MATSVNVGFAQPAVGKTAAPATYRLVRPCSRQFGSTTPCFGANTARAYAHFSEEPDRYSGLLVRVTGCSNPREQDQSSTRSNAKVFAKVEASSRSTILARRARQSTLFT